MRRIINVEIYKQFNDGKMNRPEMKRETIDFVEGELTTSKLRSDLSEKYLEKEIFEKDKEELFCNQIGKDVTEDRNIVRDDLIIIYRLYAKEKVKEEKNPYEINLN